ncbi:CHAT domain-containing protein, partial [Salidesulfovibrio brasiliensis]|uniref:CHAT domain-containing protein n=1 Tax=Salidesulfovibrio brasiliensis TaxID=221711 RepID=UPI000A5DB591
APARPGLRARPEPVVMDRGERLPMVRVTRDAASLSSAAFAHLDKDDAYAVAHLFSLYGIPSLYFGDLDTYLTDLPGTSPEEAATAGHLAGHPGLRPDAAAELARQRFKEYVLGGQEAFRDGRFDEALVSFADSLNVIDETPEFERYRPDALKFAREAAYRAGMYDEAADYAGRLAALVEEVQPGSTHHADALLSYGVIEAAAGHYGKAVPLLQKATQMLAEAGGMLDEAEALAELGVVLENSLKYRDALGTFREAAEVADLAGADSLLARQYSDMGRVLDLRLDDYVQARKEYARALEIHRAMGDSRGAAQALLDIGRCHRLLGDIQGASEHYAEALELADDDALKARIVLEQATNAWYGADYQRAFNLLGDVLAEARASDDTLLESLGLNASGMTWWTLGDTDRALRDLDESLELARTVKNREDVVASVLNNKGLVLRESGRFDEALQALNEALAMDRRSGSRWGQAYALRNIARTRLDMGDADGAWPLLSEALALTREIGNRINEAKILALTGQVALTREGPDEAAPYFDDALRVAAEVGLPEVRWRAMHGLGLVARERGDLAGAEDAFRQAVDIIESLRAGVAMQELRDGFAVGRMQPYEDLVRVLADLDRPEAAFAVAERSRARSLVEMLGNGKRRMRDELSTELFNGLTDLKGRINEQQALIKRADTDEEREVYGATLQSLRDRYRDMLLRARAANPELAGIVEAEPLDIPAVRELLDPGTSLLVYYLLDDEVLCWTVSRDSAALFRTSADRAELERLVLDYRRGLQNLEPVDVVARRLHGLLLGGVDVPEGTIGIVPHGILHHLSFATLDDGEKYFVDDHPLFRVPSASVMAYTFARRGKATGPVLVAADPDVGVPALELPFARREGRSVAFNFVDARLLLGGEASKPEVVQAMETSRMVHIAAHGEFNRENPLMSTVKLAPADGDSGDLLASDVFGINAPADLVVLSACQTGLSGVSDGDDVVGLNRAFLFAGTHVLGASLWRVSDVASAILMKSFYRNLDTVDKSEALRRAMVHVRNRYPHPGYWGAFTLTGDHR